MRKLKVGYWPLSENLKSAGDRRRLIFWAADRGHSIVTDLTQKVDVIVASEKTDFNSVVFSRNRAPIIFDLVDAYLSPLNSFDDCARGLAKKLSNQITGHINPFSKHVSDFCERSAAVICSSVEQERLIKSYNSNTHVILDSHEEIPFTKARVRGVTPAGSHQILWEGQPATLPGVGKISQVLTSLSLSYRLEFNFVTDLEYFKFLNRYYEKSTMNLLRKDFSRITRNLNLVPWTPENLYSSSKNSNIAMIPIDLTVPMQRLKPENRLLIMWRLGLPCLTSASDAYSRVSEKAGVSAICPNLDTWMLNFRHLLDDPVFAYEEVIRGQEYLRENHTRNLLLSKWDIAFESVIG